MALHSTSKTRLKVLLHLQMLCNGTRCQVRTVDRPSLSNGCTRAVCSAAGNTAVSNECRGSGEAYLQDELAESDSCADGPHAVAQSCRMRYLEAATHNVWMIEAQHQRDLHTAHIQRQRFSSG
jgi:hypothetical protein